MEGGGVCGLHCNQPSGRVQDLFLMLSIFTLVQGLTRCIKTCRGSPPYPPARHLGVFSLSSIKLMLIPPSSPQHRRRLTERLLPSESRWTKARLVWSCLFLSGGDISPLLLSQGAFFLFVCASYAGASVPPLGNPKYCWFEHFRFISRQEICSSAAFFKAPVLVSPRHIEASEMPLFPQVGFFCRLLFTVLKLWDSFSSALWWGSHVEKA